MFDIHIKKKISTSCPTLDSPAKQMPTDGGSVLILAKWSCNLRLLKLGMLERGKDL